MDTCFGVLWSALEYMSTCIMVCTLLWEEVEYIVFLTPEHWQHSGVCSGIQNHLDVFCKVAQIDQRTLIHSRGLHMNQSIFMYSQAFACTLE
jgi:hypothetical protein